MSGELTSDELANILSDPQVQDAISQQSGFPEPPARESLINFFKEIIGFGDEDFDKLSRTGNLSVGELGYLGLPVRNYLSLSRYAESEGLLKVSAYLNVKSNIMVGTSLSRKAALLNFAVTQKRVSKSLGSPSREVKTGLFNTTEKVTGVDEE